MASTTQHIEHDPIEAEARSESESVYDSELPSTSSLASSVVHYEYENGRRYHQYKQGAYFLPNDDSENDRLDLVHHMTLLRLGGRLHLAPIPPDVQEVLDLGTGTGIWAIEMGDDYPSAQILGNDLSPIQPSFVPPNVRFEIDDIEEIWTYTRKFDYIHSRYLQGSIRDWPKLVEQAFKFTKPGGWVEFQDYTMTIYSTDGSVPKDSSLCKWLGYVQEGMKKIGIESEPGLYLEKWVREAGFKNIHHEVFPYPVGSWPKDKTLKEVGLFNLANYADGIEGFSLRILTQVQGWKKEEVDVLVANVKQDLKNRSMHPLHDLHVVYAQKPMDVE